MSSTCERVQKIWIRVLAVESTESGIRASYRLCEFTVLEEKNSVGVLNVIMNRLLYGNPVFRRNSLQVKGVLLLRIFVSFVYRLGRRPLKA